MFGLLWLSLAVVLLGTPFDDTAWFTALEARDNTLPLLSASNGLICYYFPLDQECAATAIKDLLNLGTAPDLTSYSPTETECQELQRGLRMLAEHVSADVFGAAITSATADSVTDFELMTQIWVLQVGNFALKDEPTYVTFVTALNTITDWTTVQCNGSNLEYDLTTVALPDFVNTSDCGILGGVHAPAQTCASTCDGNSDTNFVTTCCNQDSHSTCCTSWGDAVCTASGCPYTSLCCSINSMYSCCPSSGPDTGPMG